MRNVFVLTAALITLAAPLRAQEGHAHGGSPYAGLETREIKALSQADVEALLAGEGMSLALPAELNGYPGPKHVLELADSLALTPEQRQATDRLMADMLAEARRLGERIVASERAMDRAFSAGTITREELREMVEALAALHGDLRAVHLGAHVAMKELLTLHQVHRYAELRGYGPHHGH